jgi:predicted Rdx family selenoprotein
MTNQHPLTDEICEQIQDSMPVLPCDEQGHILSFDGQRILDGMFEELSEVSNAEMRAAADWQLEQVIEWLKFGDQTDQNLSWERKRIGGFMEIAIALEQAMRPTNTQENN